MSTHPLSSGQRVTAHQLTGSSVETHPGSSAGASQR